MSRTPAMRRASSRSEARKARRWVRVILGRGARGLFDAIASDDARHCATRWQVRRDEEVEGESGDDDEKRDFHIVIAV